MALESAWRLKMGAESLEIVVAKAVNALPYNEFSFPRQSRLLTASDYQRVFKQGNKLVGRYSVMIYAPNTMNKARLGLAIAKKKIAKANARNLVKRIIRESFRLAQHNLPNIDIVVLARNGITKLDKTQLRHYFDTQWQKLQNSQNISVSR